MRRSSLWARRWVAGMWCGLCMFCSTCLALRSTFSYLLPEHDALRCMGIAGGELAGHLSYTQEHYGNSTCSEQGTLRGPRQLVVSVSTYSITRADLLALKYTS